MKHKFFKRCLPCRSPLSHVLRAGLVLGAACCLVLALGSCGGQTETETASHSDLPVILVGSDNYPPFHYEDANGQPTGIDVAQARGVILLAAVQHGVPIAEYTPSQVKQAVVGYGKAEKRQVMEMTRRILHLEQIPKPDDAADALALAICHGHCSRGARSLTQRTGRI